MQIIYYYIGYKLSNIPSNNKGKIKYNNKK